MPETSGARESLAQAVFEKIVEVERGIGASHSPGFYLDILADILRAIDDPVGWTGRRPSP